MDSLRVLIVVGCILSITSFTRADDNRVVYVTELDADVASVWSAFTTDEGLQSWMAPKVTIDLKIGGKMRSSYDPEGTLGDASTIENTILAFDPRHMLTLQVTTFPDGFRFERVAKGTWSIFYFAELPNSRTKLTIVGLGYTDDPLSQEMKTFFEAGNKFVIDKLKASLAEESIEKKEPAADDSTDAAE